MPESLPVKHPIYTLTMTMEKRKIIHSKRFKQALVEPPIYPATITEVINPNKELVYTPFVLYTQPPPGKITIADVSPIRLIIFTHWLENNSIDIYLKITFSPGFDLNKLRQNLKIPDSYIEVNQNKNRIIFKFSITDPPIDNFENINKIFIVLSSLGKNLDEVKTDIIEKYKVICKYYYPVLYAQFAVEIPNEVSGLEVTLSKVDCSFKEIDLHLLKHACLSCSCCVRAPLSFGGNGNAYFADMHLLNIFLSQRLNIYLKTRCAHIYSDINDILDQLLSYDCSPVMNKTDNGQTPVELLYLLAISNSKDIRLLSLLISIYNKLTLSRHYRPSMLQVTNVEHYINPFVKRMLERDREILRNLTKPPAIKSITSISLDEMQAITEKVFVYNYQFIVNGWQQQSRQTVKNKSLKVSNISQETKDDLFHRVFLPAFKLDENIPPVQRLFKAKQEFENKLSDQNRIIDIFYIDEENGECLIEGYNIWEVRHDPDKPNIIMHYIVSTVINEAISNINRYASLFVFRTCIALQYKFFNLRVISIYEALNPITILMSWAFINSQRYIVAHIYYRLLSNLIDKFIGQPGMPLEFENGQFYKHKQSIRSLSICERYGFFRQQDFKLKPNTNLLVFFEANFIAFSTLIGKCASQHTIKEAINNAVESLDYLLPDNILKLRSVDSNKPFTSLKAKL